MRARAVAQLVLLTLVGAAALAYPAPTNLPGAFVTDSAQATDASAFQVVVDRLRAGAEYYDAMGQELRRRDYPTASPFNWRTPLHLYAVAAVPWGVSRGVLTALLVALFAITMASTQGQRLVAWTAGALQLGLLLFQAAPDAVYISEVWAGALVGLSAGAFALRHPMPAVALALAALFVRELAAPYCVACALIAIVQRQWRQCGAWLAGAGAYALYYGWHASQVAAHLTASDVAASSGWLVFGGLPFLQSAVHKLGWLMLLPGPCNAVVVVLLTAGIARATAPVHVRAGSAAFAGFFLVAGQPFNDYWGWLAAPTWAIACGHGAAAIAAAARFAAGTPPIASSGPAAPAPDDIRSSHC